MRPRVPRSNGSQSASTPSRPTLVSFGSYRRVTSSFSDPLSWSAVGPAV